MRSVGLFSLRKPSSQRRSLVIGLILVLAVSFLFAGYDVFGAIPGVGDQNWAMFRHDTIHSGSSSSTAPNTNNTQWSYTTSSSVFSSPAIVDGKVYTGSSDSKVYSLNAATGALIWSYTTGKEVWSSPTVVDSKVYVSSYDGKVYCLNAANGGLIWRCTIGNSQATSLVLSSPTVADDKVYLGSYDGKVYCLNSATGAYLWNYTTSGSVWSSPAVADGKLYVGSWEGNIYCLDTESGALLWNYTTGGYVDSSPTVVDGRVYVGSWDNRVYCLNAATGTHLWNYTTGNVVESSPAVADGKVYVGSWDNKVYCLDTTSGLLIWSFATGSSVFSSPAIVDGKVYVGSRDSKIYCLNAATGVFIWSYKTDNYVDSSPAVVDGKVFVGSNDRKVYCFGLPPPSPTPTQSPSPTPSPTPVPADCYSKTFEWTYKGHEFKWAVDIPSAMYEEYKHVAVSTRTLLDISSGFGYVTTTKDPFVKMLAIELNETAAEKGFDQYETVSFMLAFVQSLPYTSDNVTTGYDEYHRFPLETLVDDGGDCEDTAVLFGTFVLDLGYGVVYINYPNHLAVGVQGKDLLGYYFTFNDKKYYYCETTGDGWEIGDIPEQYVDGTARIYGPSTSVQYLVKSVPIPLPTIGSPYEPTPTPQPTSTTSPTPHPTLTTTPKPSATLPPVTNRPTTSPNPTTTTPTHTPTPTVLEFSFWTIPLLLTMMTALAGLLVCFKKLKQGGLAGFA